MSDTSTTRIRLVASIVSAYTAANEVPAADVAGLISTVRRTLDDLCAGRMPVPAIKPAAVDPKASLFRDHIVCLGCGKRVKMLRRHIRTAHGMTSDDYRRHWDLPYDYPMVTSAYAKVRSDLAKAAGLGSHRGDRRTRLPP
jgi:predicted transcriptional regulator